MENIKITSWQDQIICGSLLGNGYISKTKIPYMGISANKNHNWVIYKGSQLSNLSGASSFYSTNDTTKWRSVGNIFWQEYRSKFYQGDCKYVSMETLDSLRAIGLAIWFGDKGYWYSGRKLGLRTTAFGESNKIIAQYFNEVGMPCEVKADTYSAQRILFDQKGTEVFLATVIHRLPEFMHIKLED